LVKEWLAEVKIIILYSNTEYKEYLKRRTMSHDLERLWQIQAWRRINGPILCGD